MRIGKLLSLILSFALLLPSSFASASTTYSVSEEQLTTLEANLDALESNNQRLSEILTEQEMELNEAKRRSETQSMTLIKLQQDLTEASEEISTAKSLLSIANTELSNAKKSLAKLEKEKASYRRKSKFWRTLAFLFLGAAGIAVAS